jgi:hypothetical protein
MTFRRLPGLAMLLTVLLAYSSVSAAQERGCTIVKKGDRDTVSAIMQGLGGAGAFVMLIGGGRVQWAMKAAAAAGLTSAVWGAAKTYFDSGSENVEICTKPTLPGLGEPQGIYVGPPSTTRGFFRDDAISRYLQSEAGLKAAQQTEPLTWYDPCSAPVGLSMMALCSGPSVTPLQPGLNNR